MCQDRVYLFVTGTFRFVGGAERQALLLAEYLVQHGAKVHFLAFEDGEVYRRKVEQVGGICHCLPLRFVCGRLQKLLTYRKIVRLINEIGAEVLIPYVTVPNKVVGQMWRWSKARFAFWNQRDEGRNLTGARSERKALLNVSAVVSNSFEGRDFLVRTYGLHDDAVHVINNGVVPRPPSDPHEWHRRLGLADDDIIVSMIANITSYKDHRTLVEAWAKVVSQYGGPGRPVLVLPGEFGPPTQELKARAFDLKLGDNLVFAGPVQDIHSLIDSSLFCVFSSNMEGCPNGVLEPMGQGKAVIGTSLSGVHQALGDRYADICLSKPNDPDDLAARILGLLRDAPLREKIARYNHDRIGTDFSVENMVRRYLGLVEQGLGKVAANDADCRHWADE